jgi:hypothetical protein
MVDKPGGVGGLENLGIMGSIVKLDKMGMVVHL